MVLLNSWITCLEETHLNISCDYDPMYQFVEAFLDRIRWGMFNLWDMFYHGDVP